MTYRQPAPDSETWMCARHRAVTALLGVIVLTATATSQLAAQGNSIQLLSWLAGCWELKHGTRTTLEMWMPPDGGLMLGASRTTVSGAVREFEQVRLRAEGGRLIYTALPSSQAEASFNSTE